MAGPTDAQCSALLVWRVEVRLTQGQARRLRYPRAADGAPSLHCPQPCSSTGETRRGAGSLSPRKDAGSIAPLLSHPVLCSCHSHPSDFAPTHNGARRHFASAYRELRPGCWVPPFCRQARAGVPRAAPVICRCPPGVGWACR